MAIQSISYDKSILLLFQAMIHISDMARDLILKEIISQHEEISELLCSYFLKTTLFWVIEETQRSIWDPKYMMLCFHLCLERLMKFIIDENCPNYFLPLNNMFNGRFSLSGAMIHISDMARDLYHPHKRKMRSMVHEGIL
jgi:hypothetical protein